MGLQLLQFHLVVLKMNENDRLLSGLVFTSLIRALSSVISSTESELEELERFHFLPISLMTPSLMIQ